LRAGGGLERFEFFAEVAEFLGEEAAVAKRVLEFLGLGGFERETGFEIDVVFAAVEAAENPIDAENAGKDLVLEGGGGIELVAETGFEGLVFGFFLVTEAELASIDTMSGGVL
jgi:hypothetical protein